MKRVCVDCGEPEVQAECRECHGALCINHAHLLNGICFDCYREITVTHIQERLKILEARQ